MRYSSKEKKYEILMYLFLILEFGLISLLVVVHIVNPTDNVGYMIFGYSSIGSCIVMLVFAGLSHNEAVKREKESS